jgi:hypothetical protein
VEVAAQLAASQEGLSSMKLCNLMATVLRKCGYEIHIVISRFPDQ